ncbi:beta strand repeat-containing protein [Mucilaginibacter psychrotolerans]|uniref:Uncharacterized protein n=1 Tax=Mucilaginibacter psychrotolerans TaxID=1524096 RepID=A0A4Y8SFE5_9SPHI|nr:hypothetical protein [Mucilaginibacter psychrotolerans]TFF37355.1 hypothetical protein E2R66_13065 [Mucilaginibacter psychrotolerans]
MILSNLRRLSIAFIVTLFIPFISFANVNITAATGGTGISADKSSGSPAAAFTTLGNIVLSSAVTTDFSSGSGLTIILTAPTNWQFLAGTGSVSVGGNISSASVVVTGTTATITYTCGAASLSNAITIIGLQVQATVKTTLSSTNITRTGGTGTIAGFATNAISGALSQVAGTFTKLQLLLPGETASPGSATGKTGTPTNPTAGTAITITVNSVDVNWNVVSSTDNIGITSTDANATLPANNTLSAGTRTFSITLKTAGSRTITATDITNGLITANTSPAVTVAVGTFTKLQLLLPGETAAPGTTTGKTGTPTNPTAGTAITVTVNSVDANWNVVSSTDNIGITSTDANATLPANNTLSAGTRTFSITLKTAGSKTITASDITNVGITANTSPAVTVAAGTFTKLQLLLPGETAAPGTATGKTGTPTNPTAGTAITVTVNSVDANWNVVSSTDNIGITSTDVNAALPANNTLSAGTRTFSITLKTVGSKTIMASDITNGAITANTSPSVTVVVGAFAKLQLLLPGETAAPGTATGKTGTPTNPTAGTAITVTVNSVDANWNVVSSTDNIGITSTDANATLPANNTLSAGTRTFSITLKTSGSRTITATDITNGVITANTSPAVTVAAGTITKLQLLLPGETAAPGTATGKTGTPTNPTAGTAITITVNSVDANWNVVSSTDNIGITCTDANAVLPANNILSAGTRTFSITLKTTGSRTITASDVTNVGITANTSPAVTVAAGTFVKLQLLLPGETAAPGTATGKTGTPTNPTAGTAITVTVNSVDANWNVVSSTDNIGITSTDANAALPANNTLSAGTRTFSITLKTVGSKTITASDITNGAITANTSPAVTVAVGAFTKLQLLMPGETAAAGTATGKTGTPTTALAGTAFNVTVNAVDANWNKVTTITQTVGITSNDPNAVVPANTALVAGTKTLAVTLKKVTATATVTATDITDGTKTANTSPSTTVVVGTFTKLQLLLPGETAAPGTATGKTGTPSARTAGTAFNVTVNAVDAAWNVVTTVTDVVAITSTDVNATLPANTALVAGTKSLSFTFKTSGTKTITTSDVTTPARTANTSPNTTVNTGTFTRLQLLLPGETAAPGTASGKTGTPTARTAGTAFNVTVNAVDANWNKVTTVTDVVQITSTDALGTMPANAALAAGTKTNFAVTLKTPGTKTITATDVTNAARTPNTSPSVTVNAGAFSKLLIVLPGETYAAGTATGKTGTAFNVTVYAVDAVFNNISSVTDVIKITSTDVNAVLPANAAAVAGSKTFSITLKTGGAKTITATDATNGLITASTSPSVTVAAGAYSQLQILLPGETAAPGTLTGATGTANPPARNTAFNITVNAVDAYYNKVTTVTNTVTITSSDATAVLPAAAALTAGTRVFSVNIKSVSTSPLPTITATQSAINKTVSVPVGVPATVATDYFRTASSGNWNDANNWQSSTNGTTNWQDATLTPTNSASGVEILTGHVITVTANVTVDQVIVDANAQVIVNSGITLTIAAGAGGTQFSVSGILNNAGTITTTGALAFLSGGKYQHNFTTTAGTIPTATWNPLSTCEIIGYTSYVGNLAGLNQTFGDFVWNCPGQNIAGNGISLNTTLTATMNSLSVISTGTGQMRLANTGGTLGVTGDYNQSGGILILNNTSGTLNLNIGGDFSMSGGTLQQGTGLNSIAFNNTTQQTYEKTGGTISGVVNFTVNTNAKVDLALL